MNDDNIVHEEKRANATLKIIRDDNFNQSPDDNRDKYVFLVGFHRDFTVEREGFDRATVAQVLCGGGDKYDYASIPEDERSEEEQAVLDNASDIPSKYHVFGLEAYIHSGVVLALSQEGNFIDRRWDVSQLGAVFISREEESDKDKARIMALHLVEDWNDYLSGNIYGYVIEDKKGNVLDSCGGYSGDWEKSGVLDDARKELAFHITRIEIRKRRDLHQAEDIAKAKALLKPYKLTINN